MKKHYKDSFDLTWIFILLALLLFVTDVTIRRLGFTRFPIRRKKKAVGRAGASGNGQAAELSGGVQASAAGGDLTSGSSGQAAAGIGGAQAASGTGGTIVSQTVATGGSEKASKKASKKDSGKKKPASAQGTGLDMSELLKKKNDRNL